MRLRMRIKKIKFRENYFFLVTICLLFVFGAYTFLKNERKTSVVENRTLATFQHFTAKDFLNGKFQKSFEDALSDQFTFSSKIRTSYVEISAALPTFGLRNAVCKNHYVAISGGDSNYSTFNCEDYILRMPGRLTDFQQKSLQTNIDNLGRLNNSTKAYYYVINTSSTYDFEEDRLKTNYANILADNMAGDYRMKKLECSDYETYKKYFYKTDLHWNYVGSYQGFLDITDLLGIKNPAKPTGVFTQNEQFFGSYARSLQKYDSSDDFAIYTFDIPEHDTIINGNKKKYNHIQEFINHDYEYSKFDFYAYFYGQNYGEIIFDFHQPEKENLLIIADSFSNPLNELIAQYFDKTYVIDLRYYKNEMGKDFVLSKYLIDNKIDKTLLIISSEFFIIKDNTTKGLEN